MPAPGVGIQFLDPRHYTGPNRIEVNIAHQLLEVGVFLTNYGFISILKKMAVASVAEVKADSVSRKEPCHDGCKGNESCPKEEMGVVGDEHPCVTGSFTWREEFGEALKEILPIPVVYENISALDTSDHDMV